MRGPADAVLSVGVIAEVDGFVSGFNRVGVTIEDLKRKILAYKDIVANSLDTKVIAKYNAMIEVTSAELNRLNNIGKKGFDSMGNAVLASGQKIAKGSNQAGLALTDLGRIAQDVPYGFIGIQNNLNPLVESFQRLKAETGSTGGALKALGSSLIGPAGLGLALSVVSAGILLYQQYQQKANNATDRAKKSTDDYVSSLNQVSQAQLKGSQSAQDELINLSLLFKAYQNGNLPLKARKEAYEQIQQQYPDYFKNIKFEQEASEKTTGAYNKLTGAILATAKARAALDLITKNSTRQLENEQKLKDLEAERLMLLPKLAKAKLDSQTGNSDITGGGSASDFKAAQLSLKINDNIREQNNLRTDTGILTKRNLELEKSVNAEIEKGAKLTGTVGNSNSTKGKPSKSELREDLIAQRNDLIFLINESAKGIQTAGITMQEAVFTVADFNLPKFKTPLEVLTEKFSIDYVAFHAAIQDIGGTVVDSLGGFFESLGEAMASGDFSNFGQGLLEAFAGFLGQLGQLFIKQGIAEIGYGIAKNLILPGSGAGNIAGGSGMVAAGAAISVGAGLLGATGSKSKKDEEGSTYRSIPGFATGVTNFSGGLAIVGEKGPELVNLPPGSDVIANNRIGQHIQGNNTNITLAGNLAVSGDQLVFLIDRTRSRQKRLG